MFKHTQNREHLYTNIRIYIITLSLPSQMSHTIAVYKDYREILNTDGEVTIQVPKAEGRLTLSHSGSVATNHVYTMTVSTGRDDSPLLLCCLLALLEGRALLGS